MQPLIRPAAYGDLPAIMEIYRVAKIFMRAHGNLKQWAGNFPSEELIRADIERGKSFVIEADGRVRCVFYLHVGADPTYAVIEDGSWLDDVREYGTIHRIASDGTLHGCLARCVAFCEGIIPNLRIDTHADNTVMQNAIRKCGFTRCGIIHIADGSPRIAYQKIATEERKQNP